jgi:peptidoglycan/LPS O-acetylase OafA/YrhL
MDKELEKLEKRVSLIEERNKRVEKDKAWETSWLRRILIVVLTYIFAVLYLTSANTTNPFFGAVVPCAGFFLSTLTLRLIKEKWSSKR